MNRAILSCLRIACVAMMAWQAGCDRTVAPTAAPGPRAAPVTAAQAVSRDVPVYLDEIGRTVAIDTVSIVPQIAGKVMAVNVEDGAYVRQGQLLFEIDPRPFQAALDASKAALAQYQADFEWAQADFKRTQELMSSNVVSQLEFEQKKSVLGVDQAKIEAAQAEIQLAQLNLEYTKIYSPIDGRAGARLIFPGNVVKANEGTMLIIQRLDPIYAEFTVTENDLGTVRKFMAEHGLEVGNEQNMGLKVQVEVPASSERVLTSLGKATTRPVTGSAPAHGGTLTFMDNTIQNGTGTVKLRATVPNTDHFFWPGQFVNARLILTIHKDAVLIPMTAEQIGQQGPYVYVVKQGELENPQTKVKTPAMIAEIRPIVAGQRQGDMMVVEEGVQAGEMVIVTGQLTVAPNGPVMVTNTAAAAPTTQTASTE